MSTQTRIFLAVMALILLGIVIVGVTEAPPEKHVVVGERHV